MRAFSGLTVNLLEEMHTSFVHSIKSIVSPLSFNAYKGVMGRVAVIGGSRDYTGAPFYAAEGALKFGADLSFIYCSNEAATPIKCYSPELMVSPFYDDSLFGRPASHSDSGTITSAIETAVQTVVNSFPRSHVLVIGPGLGRNENALAAVAEMIKIGREQEKLMVIDADGLWLLSQYPSLVRGYSRCILTPNKAEFDRLVDSLEKELQDSTWDNAEDLRTALLTDLRSPLPETQTRAVSLALGGVTVVRKGEFDLVTNGGDVFKLLYRGSPRRCGGQGDILAGCLGVAFYWASKNTNAAEEALRSLRDASDYVEKVEVPSSLTLEDLSSVYPDLDENFAVSMTKSVTATGGLGPSGFVRKTNHSRIRDGAILSTLLALSVVKQASVLAFKQHGRSMTSPDVLKMVGPAFSLIVDEGNE